MQGAHVLSNNALRIEWDEKDKKQVEEAKEKYISAKKENRRVTDGSGNELAHFRPWLGSFIVDSRDLESDDFAIRLFDETGDRRLIWNAKDPGQIAEAAKIFAEYLGRGWRAYGITAKGERSHRVVGFDPASQEIIFDDKERKTPFKKFIEKFREVKVLPRTWPG